MFTKHLKTFRSILKEYYKLNTMPFPSYGRNYTDIELKYLSAKGLIALTPYSDEGCRITVTDKGLVYFDEKHDKLFRFWLPVIISVLALFRPELTQLLCKIINFIKNC